jgi:hypothetical protein
MEPKQNVQVGVPDEVCVWMKLISDLLEEICTCGRRLQTPDRQPFWQGIADHDSYNGIFSHHYFFVFRPRGIIETVTVEGIPHDICPRWMLIHCVGDWALETAWGDTEASSRCTGPQRRADLRGNGIYHARVNT